MDNKNLIAQLDNKILKLLEQANKTESITEIKDICNEIIANVCRDIIIPLKDGDIKMDEKFPQKDYIHNKLISPNIESTAQHKASSYQDIAQPINLYTLPDGSINTVIRDYLIKVKLEDKSGMLGRNEYGEIRVFKLSSNEDITETIKFRYFRNRFIATTLQDLYKVCKLIAKDNLLI